MNHSVFSKRVDFSLVMEWADQGDIFQKILKARDTKTYFEEKDIW